MNSFHLAVQLCYATRGSPACRFECSELYFPGPGLINRLDLPQSPNKRYPPTSNLTVYVYTHTYIYTLIYTHIHVYICICICTNTLTCIHMYIGALRFGFGLAGTVGHSSCKARVSQAPTRSRSFQPPTPRPRASGSAPIWRGRRPGCFFVWGLRA